MKANYHTHTWRCNHASGTEKEYVLAAIKRGLHTLGFSDHTPYVFPGSYYSSFRMTMDQLPGYVRCVKELASEFGDQISLPVGLEAEYYPRYFPATLERLQDAGISYLIIGQHFVDNEIGAHYSGNATADDEILRRYCHQIMEAFQTGVFTYLAHPDLLNFHGSKQVYRTLMQNLCREAKGCNIPLEYNLLGVATKRHYPKDLFWEIAAEEGNTVVLGCDAHQPEALSDTSWEETAVQVLASYGITPVEVPKLQTIQ